MADTYIDLCNYCKTVRKHTNGWCCVKCEKRMEEHEGGSGGCTRDGATAVVKAPSSGGAGGWGYSYGCGRCKRTLLCGERYACNNPITCQHQFFKVSEGVRGNKRCTECKKIYTFEDNKRRETDCVHDLAVGVKVVCALCDEKRILWDNKKMDILTKDTNE